jgi:hypothetical protein
LKKQISDLKSTKAYRFWEFYHKLKWGAKFSSVMIIV